MSPPLDFPLRIRGAKESFHPGLNVITLTHPSCSPNTKGAACRGHCQAIQNFCLKRQIREFNPNLTEVTLIHTKRIVLRTTDAVLVWRSLNVLSLERFEITSDMY
jgi:hypothetical protein